MPRCTRPSTERAFARFAGSRADLVVALGCGSAICLSRTSALRTGIDQTAIETTYTCSEMTDVLGETQEGVETTRRDPAILPETAINDVDFILSVPVHISVTSGLKCAPRCGRGRLCRRSQSADHADVR